MKNLFFVLAVVLLSSCATQTSFNDFYQDHQKEAEFSLGINSSILKTFLSDDDYEDIKPLLKKAKHVRILVFSDQAEPVSKQFDKFISKSSFDEMIKIRDDGDKVNLFALEEGERIKEVVAEIKSDGELILLGFKTNLSEDDIQKMFEDADISL